MTSNSNAVASGHIKAFIDRILRLKGEIAGLNADVSEVYKEAKEFGLERRVIQAVINRLGMAADDRQALDALTALYWNAYHGIAEASIAKAEGGTTLAPRARACARKAAKEWPAPPTTEPPHNHARDGDDGGYPWTNHRTMAEVMAAERQDHPTPHLNGGAAPPSTPSPPVRPVVAGPAQAGSMILVKGDDAASVRAVGDDLLDMPAFLVRKPGETAEQMLARQAVEIEDDPLGCVLAAG